MYPSKEFLGRYQIIITTLVTAGRSESPRPWRWPHVWAVRGFPAGVQLGGDAGERGSPREGDGDGDGRKAGQAGSTTHAASRCLSPGWHRPTFPHAISPTSSSTSAATQ